MSISITHLQSVSDSVYDVNRVDISVPITTLDAANRSLQTLALFASKTTDLLTNRTALFELGPLPRTLVFIKNI